MTSITAVTEDLIRDAQIKHIMQGDEPDYAEQVAKLQEIKGYKYLTTLAATLAVHHGREMSAVELLCVAMMWGIRLGWIGVQELHAERASTQELNLIVSEQEMEEIRREIAGR